MIALCLEIHDVFFWYFLLINSVIFGVTAYNVAVFKKTWDNTCISIHFHITEINSKNQSSFLFSLKVDVVIGYIR